MRTPKPATRDRRAAEREEFDQKCMELRCAGYSFRAIGNALGVSDVTALTAVHRQLERITERSERLADEYRALNLERLNKIVRANWDRAVPLPNADGTLPPADPKATQALLAAIEQINKMLGITKPNLTMINNYGQQPAPEVTLDPSQYSEEELLHAHAFYTSLKSRPVESLAVDAEPVRGGEGAGDEAAEVVLPDGVAPAGEPPVR